MPHIEAQQEARRTSARGQSKTSALDLSPEAFPPLPAWTQLAMVVGPLVGFGLLLALSFLAGGRRAILFLLGMAAGSFVGGGKLVILAGAVEDAPVGLWPLAGFVVFGDLATASVMTAIVPYMYRIRALGRRLAAAREAGSLVLRQHKWMRRAAWLGLAVFIAVPFQGTGAVVGVVLGRMLGLSRIAVFTATAAGSVAGASGIAAAGSLGSEQITTLAEHPALGIAVAAAAVSATYLLERRFVRQCPRQP